MARPTKNDIDSGIQNWDGKIDDNDEALMNGPIPIHEHTGDETDLAATFPAAAYDRCLVWVDHTVHGHWLVMASNGTSWSVYRHPLQTANPTATISQSAEDDIVRFTGTGTNDYDLLPAASWETKTVIVRNDKSSGTLNLDPNGSEQINGGGAGIALTLATGSTATLWSDGTAIYAAVSL